MAYTSGVDHAPSTGRRQRVRTARPVSRRTPESIRLGIALKLLAVLAFVTMGVLAKIASQTVPIGQVVFARNAMALLPVLGVMLWQHSVAASFRVNSHGAHFSRALVGFTAMGFGFFALSELPLSDATALSYASPLMIVVLSAFLLGEKVRVYRWSAVVVGLLGVLVMLVPQFDPSSSRSLVGIGAALLGAFAGALAQVQVRRMTGTEATESIVVYFTLYSALFSLASIPFGWVMPSWEEALILAGVGMAGGIGQLLLTRSYCHAPASALAPFDYTSMIWAALVGFVLFDDVPSMWVLAGTAIVIAAGVFVIWRERQLGLDRTAARRAGTRLVN